MIRRPWAPLLLLATTLLGAIPAARAAVKIEPLHNDTGTYRVYFRDRLIGTEKFSLEPRGDSVLVFANVDEKIPTPAGDQRLDKKISLTFKTLDYDLLSYSSEHNFMGHRLVRGLNAHDTTFTAYRESESAGGGDTFLRPPGRMFVIDSQVFVLFDIMLRSLHGKMFGERLIPVVILGAPRDTVMEITFRPGANAPVKVQGRARTARQVSLTDGTSEFVAWVAASGQMLRLDQPASGLRVERMNAAPAAKKPALAKPSTSASRPFQATPIPPPKSKTPGGN